MHNPRITILNCKLTETVSNVSTQFPISKFSVILNIFETEQLQIGNWVATRQNSLKTGLSQDKTKLSCLVTNCVHTTDTDKTRQFCLVHVSGVNTL